jgi:Zn-dependent protease with chaperone function
MKYTAKRLQQNVNVTQTNPLKELLILLLKFTALVIGIYLALGFVTDIGVNMLDSKSEQKIMDLVNVPSNSTKSEVTDSAKIQAASIQKGKLELILNKLNKQANGPLNQPLPKLKIEYVEGDLVNAFANPNGTIEVHAGLLKRLQAEQELAFVLAHEMGHYANRDHLRLLGRRGLLLILSSTIFGSDRSINNLFTNGFNLAESRYSQTQESKADAFALKLLAKTYGNTDAASSALQKILDHSENEALNFLSTHPHPKTRLADLKKQTK